VSSRERRHLFTYETATGTFAFVMVLVRFTHDLTRIHVRTYAQRHLAELRAFYPLNKKKWGAFVASQQATVPPESLSLLARHHADAYTRGDLPAKVIWGEEHNQWKPCDDFDRSKDLTVPEELAFGTGQGDDPPFRITQSPPKDRAAEVDMPSSEKPDTSTFAELGPVSIACDASGLGSWAAVVTLPARTLHIGGASSYQGHLAELYAVVAAAEWLPGHHRTVQIYSDCISIVQLLNSERDKPPAVPTAKRKRAAPKYKARITAHDLKLRFHLAVERHGQVDVMYRPRTSPEIAAAHQLATLLARQRRTKRATS